ncbi:MAG: maleate cis-trans isomerase family protein [Thermomicrobiales bacterium]
MDQAFPGWRARLGVIYPASGLADMEYYRLCPPGVSVHVTRSSVPHDGGVTLADVLEVAEGRQFEQLAKDLATVRPHALAWMCTSGSFSRGAVWDAELCRMLSRHGACPATTTSTALVTALAAYGVRRVGLATPYETPVMQRLAGYLAEHGISAVSCVGLGLTRDWEISTLTPMDVAALVRQADCPEAEAIFLSDTCLVLSPLAEALEMDLRKPVFSANMVTMWHALHLAGVREAPPGIGSLFRLHPARDPPRAQSTAAARSDP